MPRPKSQLALDQEASVKSLLELFEGPLRDVAFPGVDGRILAVLSAQVTQATNAVEAASTALAEALRDGRIAYAGLDVRDPEPPDPAADPLAGLSTVLATPHVAASSQEAVEDLHLQAAEICVDLLRAAGRLPA